jgi:isopenicillin N synthase-like dioxygenase
MQFFRDKFVTEHAGWAGDEPSCGYPTWDAAMADYNEDLTYLGGLLADAVAEALGMEQQRISQSATHENN